MKNKYVKEFFIRGIAFSSLGPIVLGIVYMILSFCKVDLNLQGWQILLGIVSTIVIAFVQAGSSVFEQIEEWSIFKSLFFHLLSIYLVYMVAYLVNRWIPFNWIVIVIFTGAVILTFLLIWLICFLANRNYKKKLDSLLK